MNDPEGTGRFEWGNNIHHPSHYMGGGIECIEAIRASMSPLEFQGYCKGNAMKYIWRFRMKGGHEDLAKAKVYLDWLGESVYEEEVLAVPSQQQHQA